MKYASIGIDNGLGQNRRYAIFQRKKRHRGHSSKSGNYKILHNDTEYNKKYQTCILRNRAQQDLACKPNEMLYNITEHYCCQRACCIYFSNRSFYMKAFRDRISSVPPIEIGRNLNELNEINATYHEQKVN